MSVPTILVQLAPMRYKLIIVDIIVFEFRGGGGGGGGAGGRLGYRMLSSASRRRQSHGVHSCLVRNISRASSES